MSKPANKTVIGIFVVVALALLVAAILILGSGKFFKNNPKFVLYFQGSVKGLAAGSPVNFRGVKVGTVTEIKMLLNPKDLSLMIPVYVEFEPGSLEAMPGSENAEQYRKAHSERGFLVKEMITHGLRAQLEMQSVVTGQLMVSLDLYPDKPAILVGADKRYPEIPTVPTTFQQLAEKLEKLPFEQIINDLRDAVAGIDKTVNSPEMEAMMKSLVQGVGETRELIKTVDRQVEPLIKSVAMGVDETRALIKTVSSQVEPLGSRIGDATGAINRLASETQAQIGPLAASLTKSSDEANLTLKRIQVAVGNVNDMTGEDSAVVYRLTKSVNDLGAAAQSLRLVADKLHQQPNSVIFGSKDKGGK
jgi:paraquat-inducible protein B